jgi:hypothetical protein
MRKRTLVAAVAAALVVLTGCDMDFGDFGGSERYTEDFRYSYPLKAGGRLSMENFNGSIEISSWNDNSIEITGSKYAPTIELRDAMKIDISAQPDAIHIRTVRPSERRGNMGARYFIRVPRQTRLDRIVSSNGGIRVVEVEGAVRLRTSNGAVRAENLLGSLEVQTSNGGIEIRGQDGGAVLRTTNGRIRVEDIRGALEAVTSNGGINARIAKSEPGRTLRAETSNGGVDIAIDDPASDVRISTSNGGITLRLPERVSGRLLAATNNSSVRSELDVQTSGPLSKNRLEGALGSGAGPFFDLSTSNGTIRILRQ